MATMVLSVGALAEFQTNDQTNVYGLWKYDNGWKQGKFPTATFQQGVFSNDAGSSLNWIHQTYSNDWKLDKFNDYSATDTTNYFSHTDFKIWTVNTPLKTGLTPGQNGLATNWMTNFNFGENVVTKFLNSQLSFVGMVGEGVSRIISDWNLMTGTDNRVDETTILQVNPQLP